MEPIRTILHPTDFSEQAGHAFRFACSLARDHGANVVLLHVMPPPYPVVGEMIAIPPLATEEEESALMEARLYNRLHALRAAETGLDTTVRLEAGDTVETILRVAEDLNADLIVMGTHGRTGLTRLVMGSVAENVVRRAGCAVLTLKNPKAVAAAEPPVVAMGEMQPV